jgi:hypothetical protein
MFIESSLNDLYQSTVSAFPKTKFRQHSTDEITITQLQWTPFLGLKTLLIRGLAENKGNRHQYNTIMLFKEVDYDNPEISIVASDGKRYGLKKLSSENNQILVRCNCLDHKYRFRYFNYLDHSLFGKKSKKYEGQGLWQANPLELPGLCKHVISLGKALKDAGILI